MGVTITTVHPFNVTYTLAFLLRQAHTDSSLRLHKPPNDEKVKYRQII